MPILLTIFICVSATPHRDCNENIAVIVVVQGVENENDRGTRGQVKLMQLGPC
jgi:hypothetical protein